MTARAMLLSDEEIEKAAEAHAVATVCETCEHYDEELSYARKDFIAGARFALAAAAEREKVLVEALEIAKAALTSIVALALVKEPKP